MDTALANLIGRRVSCYNEIGTIVDASPSSNDVHVITNGRLCERKNAKLTIVYRDADEHGAKMRTSDLAMISVYPLTILHWAYPDPTTNQATPEEVEDLKRAGTKGNAARETARRAAEAARNDATLKAEATLKNLCPSWAKSVVVAELEKDESDIMTDYFHVRATRKVVLAWSKSERNNFNELRKAARCFTETSHLATAGKEAEHRNGDFFLKAGFRYSTGWVVRKVSTRYVASDQTDFSLVQI